MNTFSILLRFARSLAVCALVLGTSAAQSARANDYSAMFSGPWSNPSIWTPWGVPDFGDRAFIGSSYGGGAISSATVALGSTWNVDSIYLGYGAASSGTLNLAGQSLYVGSTIALGAGGGRGTIAHNGGFFTTAVLSLDSGNSLTLGGSDVVTNNLVVSGTSQVTTVSQGNVVGNASLDLSSTLTLAAPVVLSGQLDIERNSTFNMAGNRLTAANVALGATYGQPVTVLNRGPITATNLSIGNGTFDLSASDTVSSFSLSSATTTLHTSVNALSLSGTAQATTTPTGNVNNSIALDLSSTLRLGAPLTLSGQIDVERNAALDMNYQPLRANSIVLGAYYQQPVSLLHRGPIVATNLSVSSASLDLSASDAVTNFTLSGGTSALHGTISTLTLTDAAQAITTAANNISGNISLDLGSTLSLGAPLITSGQVDVERGSTLNLGGNPLIASSLVLANYYGQPANLVNRGPIYVTNVSASNGTFDLSASDAVTNLSLTTATGTLHSSVYALNLTSTAQAATTAAGNVTGNVGLDLSSTLSLGAPMTLSGQIDLERNSVLDMNGQPLRAGSVLLGWYNWYYWGNTQPITILHRGPITATTLDVATGAFNLSASDSVTNFSLLNVTSTLNSSVVGLTLSNTSQVTTTPGGNVNGSASLDLSSTLTLGAPMALSGNLQLERSSVLNMAGNRLTAQNVYLSSYGDPVTIINRGPITAASLSVGSGTFDLTASDAVAYFSLNSAAGTLHSFVNSLNLSNSAQVTTTATGSAIGNVSLDLSSTLTLGAPMLLGGQINVERGATLDMRGQPLRASSIYLGYYSQQPVSVINRGPITAGLVSAGAGGGVTLRATNSAVNSQIAIFNNTVLTLEQPNGQVTGMTFRGSSSGALAINDTSVLQLSGGSNSGPSWIFRWQDSANGTWESALNSLIAAGRLAISPSAGYSIFDEEGYTYVAGPTTLTWSGTGGDNNWSTAANWGGSALQAGHWLRFGPLASSGHAANNNDAAGSPLFYGIFFDAAAPAYTLQGNPIQLSGAVLNQSGTNQTIGLDIQLVHGNGAFNEGVFDTGGMTITDTGSISGSGMRLVKTGSGTLVLSGTNTYSGGTELVAGKLVVTSPSALLDGSDLIIGGAAATSFAAPVIPNVLSSAAGSPLPVPEPGSFALLAIALGVAAGYRRRHTVQRALSRLKERQ